MRPKRKGDRAKCDICGCGFTRWGWLTGRDRCAKCLRAFSLGWKACDDAAKGKDEEQEVKP